MAEAISEISTFERRRVVRLVVGDQYAGSSCIAGFCLAPLA